MTREELVERVLARLPVSATYQRDVAKGLQNLSGSDIRGNARGFGRAYAFSRGYVARVWVEEGGHVRRKLKGQLSLEPGPPPETARQGRDSALAGVPVWEHWGEYSTSLVGLSNEEKALLNLAQGKEPKKKAPLRRG